MLYMQYPGYSFVFPAAGGEDVETSQGVKMQIPEVKALYTLFRAGRLKEGMHAGPLPYGKSRKIMCKSDAINFL